MGIVCLTPEQVASPQCTTVFDCARSQEGFDFNGGATLALECGTQVPVSLPWVGCDGTYAPNAADNGGGVGLRVTTGSVQFQNRDGLTNSYLYTLPRTTGRHTATFTWGNSADPALCTVTITFDCIALEGDMPAKTGPGVVEIMGFGTEKDFGTGGDVYFIENRSDSGVGSARVAFESAGRRIIVPKISGTIPVPKTILVNDPNMTFMGSEAPGSGINLQATPGNNTFTLRTTAQNLYFENIGIFQNNDNTGDVVNRDALNISKGSRFVVFNQFAAAWGADETISVFDRDGDVGDVTLQYGIVFEGLSETGHPSGEHSKGGLVGNNLRRITTHHCVFAGNARRNLRFDGDELQFINNVTVSSCGARFRGLTIGRRSAGSQARIDVKGNRLYGRDGPNRPVLVYPPQVFGQGPVSIYASGNRDDRFVTSAAQSQEDYFGGYDGGQPPYAVFRDAPQMASTDAICTHEDADGDALFDYLMGCVGPHSWARSPEFTRVLGIRGNAIECTSRARQLY